MSALMQNLGYSIAFVCLLLALHLFRSNAQVRIPARLLGLCFLLQAVQAVVLSLVLLFGRPSIPAILLPCIALLIGPLFLLCFQSTTRHDFRFKPTMILHLLPSLFVLVQFVSGQFWLDIDAIILLSFLVYTVWLARMVAHGAQQFAHLEPYRTTIFNWLKVATALMAISLLSEMVILAEILSGRALNESLTLLIILCSELLLVGITLLAALQKPSQFDWVYQFGIPLAHGPRDPSERLALQRCVAQFDEVIIEQKRYTEGELSLKEIARLLNTTPRHVSNAINLQYQQSVSRVLNDLRVNEAMNFLRESPEMSVTDVMFASGFRTKSSFNKEFRVRRGVSPSQFRLTQTKNQQP